MINVTEYINQYNINHKEARQLTHDHVHNFLKRERVKYLIRANGYSVVSKSGRYGGTSFSDELFGVFQLWLQRIPLPLLNRKEYEVDSFIRAYFGEEVIGQFAIDGYVYDWAVPSKNLLIEFNETHHNKPSIKSKDYNKAINKHFIIHEDTVMADLAKLATLY
jgi:hypothetical protein